MDFHNSNLDKILVSEEGFLHKHVTEVLPVELAAITLEKLDIVLKTGETQVYEYSLTIGDEIEYFESRIVYSTENSVLAIVRDITERKRTEESLLASESRYRSVISVSNTGVWEYSNKKKYLWCTKEYFEMLGRNVSDYIMDGTANINEVWVELLHPDDRDKAFSIFMEYLKNGSVGMYENYYRMKHANGSWLWIWSRGQTLKNTDGNLSNLTVGTHINITELKEMEFNLFNEKEKFKTTLISIGDGVISTDIKGNVLIMNKVSEQLTGWTQEEAVGKPIEEVFYIMNEFTREPCENPVKRVLETGETVEMANHTMLISKDGTERPIEDSAAPIKDESGNIRGVVLVFRDFTEKKRSQDEIKYLSFHDHLTRLYNRRFFEVEMERIDTERNLPISIIMGDVNGLKLINDTFGHSVGDELLVKATKILKDSFRADDIVARVGGDEIAVLLPKTDASEAKELIKRLQTNLKKEQVRDIEISISFGCETKIDSTESLALVLKKAEDYMYNNKLFESPSVRGRVIDNIITTINAKSPREKAHSERVSQLCIAIGDALKMGEYDINRLKALGLFHDIGKIAIADDILNKPDKLTESEYKEICRHAEIGYRVLSAVNDMSEMAEHVLYHHERWDGKGYPKGLKGGSIPLPSRICALADAYDAMTSDRSYRPAMSNEDAVAELKKNAGTQFDPELVEVFVEQVLPEYRNGNTD